MSLHMAGIGIQALAYRAITIGHDGIIQAHHELLQYTCLLFHSVSDTPLSPLHAINHKINYKMKHKISE